MTKIDIVHPIHPNLLSQKYYVQSLTDQAVACGLLHEMDMVKIQTELLTILAAPTDQWNQGESSSIRVEKAQDILASILFVIGVQLKTCASPEAATELLKTEPLFPLFERGLVRVRRKLTVARTIQRRLKKNLLNTPNVYYRSTVVDGINGFFKLYRPQFSAHEIHITADYPAYLGRPELLGIEFIEQYLRYIEAENSFCVCFDDADIHHLLCGLSRDYHSVPMNLYEPVLASSLGLVLTDRDPKPLNLTAADIASLYGRLQNKMAEQIRTLLEQALDQLIDTLGVPSQAAAYARSSLPTLAATISNAVRMKTLDKVLLVPAYPENEPVITFPYGDRMADRKYSLLTKEILQAPSSEEKVHMILREVHSLADLLDIMADAELCQEEFKLLVGALPMAEFAILLKTYPNDDFLSRDSEQMLYEALQKRRELLSPVQREQLNKAIEMLKS